MASEQWTAASTPDQTGKNIIVTGGNSGIGYEAALVLAGKGANIILAVRSVEKGREAADLIRQTHPRASVNVMALDLADLASVRQFAAEFQERYPALHVLINNAGVMALPYRKTKDGFEMQFGTNHLGHFALTGLLMPVLLATPNARVVTVSSGAHTRGKINFDDLQSEQKYERWTAYSQTKFANVLFAYELQRKFEAAGASAISLACHPGYVATNLQAAGPRMEGSRLKERLFEWGNRLIAGSAAQGAMPTLYAATSPDANGCDYIGPNAFGKGITHARKQKSIPPTYDPALARRLWEVSEQLTGVAYDFAPVR